MRDYLNGTTWANYYGQPIRSSQIFTLSLVNTCLFYISKISPEREIKSTKNGLILEGCKCKTEGKKIVQMARFLHLVFNVYPYTEG
jgi:hypothetical protein